MYFSLPSVGKQAVVHSLSETTHPYAFDDEYSYVSSVEHL